MVSKSIVVLFDYSSKSNLIVKGLGQVGSSGNQRNPEVLRGRLRSVLALVGAPVPFEVDDVVVYSAHSSHPVYNVKLSSAAAVDSILREFFNYTRRSNPVKRPAELDNVSLNHAVTPGTRIRISLLRVSLKICCAIFCVEVELINCFLFMLRLRYFPVTTCFVSEAELCCVCTISFSC